MAPWNLTRLLVAVTFLLNGTLAQQAQSIPDTVDRLLKDYDKRSPPRTDGPTPVSVGMYFNSFYAISEQSMDYSISFYFRQSWQDPRLAFNPFTDSSGQNITKITLSSNNDFRKLWLPDTFFRNSKEGVFHDVTVPNRLLTLSYKGDLWYVLKITGVFSCPMKLQKYPFDTQHCPLMIESFGYTMDTLYFKWLPSPVDIDPKVQLPQFTLKDKILYDCSQNYTAGAFPCLEVQFVLERDSGYYILQVYVPSALIVILSWVSFWISADSAPARVFLTLLCALTLSSQSAWISANLPRVSYIKAVDVWFSVCLLMVVASLLEFAVVHLRKRRRAKASGLELGTASSKLQEAEATGGGKRWGIDKICRIVFPVVFAVFVFIYALIYAAPQQPPRTV